MVNIMVIITWGDLWANFLVVVNDRAYLNFRGPRLSFPCQPRGSFDRFPAYLRVYGVYSDFCFPS
jgi:hypothetical protein